MPYSPVGWFSRRSLGQKLAVSFGLILLLLAGSLSAILVYLSRVNSYVDRHQRITVPAIVTAAEMLQVVSQLEADVHRLLQHETKGSQKPTLDRLGRLESQLATALDTYGGTHAARTHPILFGMLTQHGRVELADREDAAIEAITQGIAALESQRRRIAEALGTERPQNLVMTLEPAYDEVAARLESSIGTLIEVHRLIDVEMKIEGDRLVEQARLLTLLLVCLLGLLILGTYLRMKRQVATPLRQLAGTADRVAHHDFTAQFVPVPGRDEVSRLADSLATMLASLREHGSALMRKTKDLEAFTYSVAHDLKGPLREIEGFSSLLEKRFAESGDPQVTHQIKIIHKSALRLSHMIDALLKYSRLGQQTLPRSRFNVLEMISSLLVDRQSQAGTKPKITVSVPFPDLYGEPISIRQALTNLLDNALKFSRTDPSPAITIGGQQTDTERIIWVRDNGIGFDADQRDKIFGLFERLHAPDDYEGTGVGLAIVKLVMERHGGRVWAESSPGKGATFYLAFQQ